MVFGRSVPSALRASPTATTLKPRAASDSATSLAFPVVLVPLRTCTFTCAGSVTVGADLVADTEGDGLAVAVTWVSFLIPVKKLPASGSFQMTRPGLGL